MLTIGVYVDQYDSWLICRPNCRSTGAHVSIGYISSTHVSIGWLSLDYVVDSQSTVDWHVGRMSVESRLSSDRYIAWCIGRCINQGTLKDAWSQFWTKVLTSWKVKGDINSNTFPKALSPHHDMSLLSNILFRMHFIFFFQKTDNCFYQGTVQGLQHSVVAISTCHGIE